MYTEDNDATRLGPDSTDWDAIKAESRPALRRLHQPPDVMHATLLGLDCEVNAAEGDAHAGWY
jgi:hypothetical protein